MPRKATPNGFTFDADQTRLGMQTAFFNSDDNQVKAPFAAPGGDMWGNTYLKLEDHAMEVRDAATNAADGCAAKAPTTTDSISRAPTSLATIST